MQPSHIVEEWNVIYLSSVLILRSDWAVLGTVHTQLIFTNFTRIVSRLLPAVNIGNQQTKSYANKSTC